MSKRDGKSDCGVVPKKRANKTAGATLAVVESVEGRPQAKGNAVASRMSRSTMRTYDMGTALDGIRQTAKGQRETKFTALLHHVWAIERLEAAYLAVSRRSQRCVTWKRMYRLMNHWLPNPKIRHPYPSERLIVNTRGRSRMR
jgi:hypothetical protein